MRKNAFWVGLTKEKGMQEGIRGPEEPGVNERVDHDGEGGCGVVHVFVQTEKVEEPQS